MVDRLALSRRVTGDVAVERPRHVGRRRRSVDDGGADTWSLGDGDADANGGGRVSLEVGSGRRPGIHLRPAARLSLSLLAEAQTHDRVRTQVYRSELQPTVLYRRWLSALLAEGFASDAREPACIKAGLSRISGCSGLHRSRFQELVWTIAPEGDGSALVVHVLRPE
jgi:hypothetical protein